MCNAFNFNNSIFDDVGLKLTIQKEERLVDRRWCSYEHRADIKLK